MCEHNGIHQNRLNLNNFEGKKRHSTGMNEKCWEKSAPIWIDTEKACQFTGRLKRYAKSIVKSLLPHLWFSVWSDEFIMEHIIYTYGCVFVTAYYSVVYMCMLTRIYFKMFAMRAKIFTHIYTHKVHWCEMVKAITELIRQTADLMT